MEMARGGVELALVAEYIPLSEGVVRRLQHAPVVQHNLLVDMFGEVYILRYHIRIRGIKNVEYAG